MTQTVNEVLSGVDLTEKICAITGATSGLGLMTARGLASAGATVVLAGRDAGRLRSAAEAINSETPTAVVETVEVELDRLTHSRPPRWTARLLRQLGRPETLDTPRRSAQSRPVAPGG
jgi:NAD(P)-dependent dehydrogenase (short-subunit alcohol dehydrogenase family)